MAFRRNPGGNAAVKAKSSTVPVYDSYMIIPSGLRIGLPSGFCIGMDPAPDPITVVSTGRNRSPASLVGRKLAKSTRTGTSPWATINQPK